MIELIFIIVILGILAAVAIPRLNATRDDARLSKAAMDVSVAVNDIIAYYTAHGKFPKDSNGYKVTDATDVKLDRAGNVDYYSFPTDDFKCIWFYFQEIVSDTTFGDKTFTAGDKILRVSPTGSKNNQDCNKLRSIVQKEILDKSPFRLGGTNVEYQ